MRTQANNSFTTSSPQTMVGTFPNGFSFRNHSSRLSFPSSVVSQQVAYGDGVAQHGRGKELSRKRRCQVKIPYYSTTNLLRSR